MIEKYNPHSLQKQARKWPVFLSEACLPNPYSLTEDMKTRQLEAWNGFIQSAFPDSISLNIPKEYLNEFGIDACRVAAISPDNNKEIEHSLELAFKWVGSIFSALSNPNFSNRFDLKIWIEAIYCSKDFLDKNKPYQALAQLKSAQKKAPINSELSTAELAIVLAGLFPFIPIIIGSFAHKNNICLERGLSRFIANQDDLIVVRYSIGTSGWHWKCFEKSLFDNSAKNCFNCLAVVKKTFGQKKYKIVKTENGYKLCLPTTD